MTLQDPVILLSTTVFMLITIAFAVRYCNILRLAQEEYVKAKNIVGEIVLSLKRRQDKQSETIEQLAFQFEATQSAIERLTGRFHGVEGQVKDLALSVKPQTAKNEELAVSIDTIKREVENIAETQKNLQYRLTEFESNAQKMVKVENAPSVEAPQLFANLTETERDILQFLTNEGAKTAPEVEKRVGKTREHTARLMKKLWQEGYIERDTHKIPYVYQTTENFKMRLKELEKT